MNVGGIGIGLVSFMLGEHKPFYVWDETTVGDEPPAGASIDRGVAEQ